LSSIRGLPYPVRADDPRVQKLRRQLVDEQKTQALAALDQAIIASADANGVANGLNPPLRGSNVSPVQSSSMNLAC